MRILVTAAFSLRYLDQLRRLGEVELDGAAVGRPLVSADSLAARVPAFDVLIVGADPVTAEVLRANPTLKAVGCCRGDPVNVDLAVAAELGIPVLFTPGRNADAVADFTIGLMIAEARHIARTHHLLRRRVLTEARTSRAGDRAADAGPGRDVIWTLTGRPRPSQQFMGPELRDKVLGIIGYGTVGEKVAHRALAFGMTVLAYDPYRPQVSPPVTAVDLHSLLERSDFISLHCKWTPETAGMIGAAELARVKPTAILINTARGGIVDHAALLEALQTKRLAGAALDVYPEEPLAPDDPLLDLDNVTLTPHLAGASADVVERHSQIIYEDLVRLLAGQRPHFLASPK